MTQATKVEVIYEDGIRYSSLTANENTRTDEQLVDTEITIKNCRLGFSSLNQKQPPKGHAIQIVLSDNSEDVTISKAVRESSGISEDTNFADADKLIRKKAADSLAKSDRTVEFVKTSLSPITQDQVLKGYFKQAEVGGSTLNVQLSNRRLLDEQYEQDEDGNFKGKYINDIKEARSNTVKAFYKCVNDKSTGEPIKPEVFKIDESGNKVTSFINPKTKQEQDLYVSGGDVVTVVVRPYIERRSTDKIYVMKYNLLSMEITASGYKGSSNSAKSTQVAQGVSDDVLADVFGITETVTASKKVDAPSTKAVKEEAKSNPIPKKEAKTKTVAATVDVSDIDLSELDDLDPMMDMGE